MTTIIQFTTSPQAAQRLNLTHCNLLQLLRRYPHLRPAVRVGLDFIWTDEDLERVKAHRARRRRLR